MVRIKLAQKGSKKEEKRNLKSSPEVLILLSCQSDAFFTTDSKPTFNYGAKLQPIFLPMINVVHFTFSFET